MAFKFKRFKQIAGVFDRRNDVLYSPPLISSAVSRILVFFCGDTQDFRVNMAKYRDSVRFQDWCLESTLNLMAKQFPQNHILIIQPARRQIFNNVVLNCFDNFVSGSKYGTPSFCPNYSSLLHLKTLLQSLSKQIPEDSHQVINKGELSLMGFSKGCIVLNQFLHEFHYYQNMEKKNEEVMQFISQIKEMWWLDGGHPGQKDTWITDKTILDSFIKMGIDVYVHVTPYQVRDCRRPWIRTEEQTFSNTLQKGGANIQRFLHFEDQPPKLECHFRVLQKIKCVE